MINRVRAETGHELSIRALFDAPAVADLARRLPELPEAASPGRRRTRGSGGRLAPR
ncbi:hypothetical protein NKH77_02125 [Streptomyces sp. M19]